MVILHGPTGLLVAKCDGQNKTCRFEVDIAAVGPRNIAAVGSSPRKWAHHQGCWTQKVDGITYVLCHSCVGELRWNFYEQKKSEGHSTNNKWDTYV